MKLIRSALWLGFALALSISATAQIVTFSFPAGSDEDKVSDEISKETDAQKKIALLQDFVQKFSSNPLAVAFGDWQLAQAYQSAGDLKAAREAGEKALAAEPNAIDVAVALANIAQQAKDNAGVVAYAAKGAAAYNSIAKQTKPAEASDAEFANQIKHQQDTVQPTYDFLEGAAYNAIAAEQNPTARLKLAQQFAPAFPRSRYSAPVAQQTIVSLLQASDFADLSTYGEQAVKDHPENASILLMVASGYGQDQKSPAHLEKAVTYARHAAELAQADASLPAEQKTQTIGAAKSIVGWSLLQQDKAAAAIPELKEAAPMLKSSADDYSRALFGLAFAYAKLNRYPEAKGVLTEAVSVQGPYQQMSRDLLQKVNSAKPAVARKQ